MSASPSSTLSPWFLRSIVVRGHQRGGALLGFPTANMFLREDTIEHLSAMENGVFFGWGAVEKSGDEVLPVVLSVGHNPHFADKAVTVEVHIVKKFTADFYGATMRILVLGKLRDQKKYTGVDALIEDIKNDVRTGIDNLGTEAAMAYKRSPLLSKPMPSTEAPLFVGTVEKPSDL